MTDKCWFALQHHHHAPPVVPEDGLSKAWGPVCIGHMVPNPKVLDIINPDGPEVYPPSMPVYKGETYDLEWRVDKSTGIDLSGEITAPIAAAIGLTVESNAGIAFKQWVNRFWKFDKLDTYYVNLTQTYLDDCMESKEVRRWMASNKVIRTPPVFVITGIMVARGAEVRTEEGLDRGANVGAKVDVPEIAGAGTDVNLSRKANTSMSHKASDFVFAIKVAKISKGWVDGEWAFSTLTRGSTFAAGDNPEERMKSIHANLATVGLQDAEKVGSEDPDDMFVLATDDPLEEDTQQVDHSPEPGTAE